MRFVAPARADVPSTCFDQPIFAALSAYRDLLAAPRWPDIATLDARLAPLRHRQTGAPLQLVAQDAIDDGCHYEARIHAAGRIATRADNWHDLFNALCWARFPAIKSALNARQAADLARVGPGRRTRAQDALTQFDEAGAVVVLRDDALLAAWDAHDWESLFLGARCAWGDGRADLHVFGHALYEHALEPALLPVAKALVFLAPARTDVRATSADVDALAAEAIVSGAWLVDPQELRPLPLVGLPGWHGRVQDAAFYRELPCFRPRRADRRYPTPRLFGAQSAP